jgi:hypothetical protein
MDVLNNILMSNQTSAQSKIAALQEMQKIVGSAAVGTDSKPERIRDILAEMEESVGQVGNGNGDRPATDSTVE